ncbi:hypothetical protein K438DRAFT_1784022 [Mycena galopus ATCC 62051]|nr:hypothetical protein K438DRAFT_1784022 [Mycena galopus ATCC 62051]
MNYCPGSELISRAHSIPSHQLRTRNPPKHSTQNEGSAGDRHQLNISTHRTTKTTQNIEEVHPLCAERERRGACDANAMGCFLCGIDNVCGCGVGTAGSFRWDNGAVFGGTEGEDFEDDAERHVLSGVYSSCSLPEQCMNDST